MTKKTSWTKRLLSMMLALCMLCTIMPVSAADELGTQENPVTDFADLQTVLDAASGTKDNPAEIYISGLMNATASIKIREGDAIKLIGVGAGEHGLKRASTMVQVGDSKPGELIEVQTGGYLELEDVVLDGGAVWSDGADSTNTGIKPGDSGLFAVRQNAEAILLDGTVLRNNEKGGGGGAIWLVGTLTIDGATIENNKANGNGGAIVVRNDYSKLYIKSGSFSGNYSTGDGGAIYIQDKGLVEMSGGVIEDNIAASGKSGGAIRVKGTFKMSGGEISGNTSGNNGGAIYLSGTPANLDLTGGEITDNTAGGTGGAIHMNNSGQVIKVGGSIDISGNKAGSAENNIFLSDVDRTITVTSALTKTVGVTPDKADTTIAVMGEGVDAEAMLEHITLDKASEDYEFAAKSGKIVYAEKLDLSDAITTFEALKAAIAAATTGVAADPVVIKINGMIEAPEKLVLNHGQHIKLIGVGAGEHGLKRTSAFTTEGNGGSKPGDMIDVGNNNGDNVASIVLENIVLDGGAVWSGSENTGLKPGDSGLMSVRKSASAVLGEGTVLRNNEKGGGGAAIWLQGTLTIDGATIENNKANGNGGAIVVRNNYSVLNMVSGSITDNTATNGGSGAVYIQDKGTVNLSGGEISGNTANGADSNIAVKGGTIVIADALGSSDAFGFTLASTADGAVVANRGAGCSAADFEEAIDALSIDTETANVMTVQGQQIVLKDPDAVGNDYTAFEQLKAAVAAVAGSTAENPAVIEVTELIAQPETLTIPAGQFIKLVGKGASGAEAGLARGKASFTDKMIDIPSTSGLMLENFVLDGGAIWSDGAGSTNTGIEATDSMIIVQKGAVLTVSGTSVLRNNAKGADNGGAITVSGTLYFEGGTMTGNYAGKHGAAIYLKGADGAVCTMSGGTITGNYAINQGGALYEHNGGTFTLSGGTISDNYAASETGAVRINNGTFNMTGGEIKNNETVKKGGGVFINNGGVFNMSGGKITGNTVTTNDAENTFGGGGLYMNAGSGQFNMTGGEISGNTAAGNGGGVYAYKGAVNVSGNAKISDNSSDLDSDNLYVANTGKLYLKAAFGESAKIGVLLGEMTAGAVVAEADDAFGTLTDAVFDYLTLDGTNTVLSMSISDKQIVLVDNTNGCDCENGFVKGNGSAQSPYRVATAADLAHVAEHSDAYFLVTADIEVSDWTPLAMAGSFNGGGFEISGLDDSLFSEVAEDAVVFDLTVSGAITVSGADAVGGVAAESAGEITGVTSNVDITIAADADASAMVGGLVGCSTGIVTDCTYSGTITDNRAEAEGYVGAIIGKADIMVPSGLPKMITAHAGFAAPGGSSDQSEDNTMDNIIKAVNYGPDAVEVDVQTGPDGKLWLGHDGVDASKNPTVKDTLLLLMGQHERSDELNENGATVRIQLDSKEDGNLDEILALIAEINFPYDRVILAGDNSYNHVLANIDGIRAAVNKGMDFWMNPNFILSYDAMANDMESFLARIEALNLPTFTVNSSYADITDAVKARFDAEGINVSVWTLNSTSAIQSQFTRGMYNTTSRLLEILEYRAFLESGVQGNNFDETAGWPEVGETKTEVEEEKGVTDFETLEMYIKAAKGTAENPAVIKITGMIEAPRKLVLNDGQHIKLVGVGDGENGLIRAAVYDSGDMLDVGNNNNNNVATLVLENIVIDGGKNVGAPALNSSLVSVRGSAKVTLGEGSVLRNNVKTGGGSAVWIVGTLIVDGGKITGNETTGGNNGGGVYLRNPESVLIMKDGEITGNKAGGASGGGVQVNNKGTVKLEGGKISGNTAAGNANNIAVNAGKVEIMGALSDDDMFGLTLSSMGEGTVAATLGSGADASVLTAALDNLALDVESALGFAVDGSNIVLADTTTGCDCEDGFVKGNGSEYAPYQINDAAQLAHVAEHADASFKLMGNIEVSDWTPVALNGAFNGNGFTVSGLDASLFASIGADGAVYDLTVDGAITVGKDDMMVGGLAAESAGEIENVTSTVDFTIPATADKDAMIGGIVGYSTGMVCDSTYSGTITDVRANSGSYVGEIIGCSAYEAAEGLPTMVTAHAGFAAAGGPNDGSEDNTLSNMIKAINLGADAIEVDVVMVDGVLMLAHGTGALHANSPTLLESMQLLMGTHARSNELNENGATVRIQFDSKQNGLLDEILAMIEAQNFPWERVILAGDNSYSHVQDNMEKIGYGVSQGMDFWMNPNFILSYDAMVAKSDEFLAKIEALGLSSFTVNSSNTYMSEDVQEWLESNGLNVSVWTLNDAATIERFITRGVYNTTSRLLACLEARNLLRDGVLGNTYGETWPEIGAYVPNGVNLYVVDFETPAGARIIVKDESGNEVEANPDGSYTLEEGETYTYIVTKTGCQSKRGTITEANEDETIEVTLKKKTSSADSAVSKTDKEIEATEDLIDAIGKVTLNDAEAIEEAREAYDDLTAAQKRKVGNYDELVAAEKKLEALLEAEVELPFTDVSEDDAICEAVKFMYANGLMVGVDDGTKFAPEMSLSRAMIAQILYTYEEQPAAVAAKFVDVARGMWFTEAIDWASAVGIISGYGNGSFGPNDVLTREQLAVMLYQYAIGHGWDTALGGALTYPDAQAVSSWAADAVQWAANHDILTANGAGNLAAGAAATRADVASAFMAFVKNCR